MFRRSRFAFAVAAAVAVSMSAARPALADEAAYERCLGDHTSLITNYIIKQCRVDMAKRTPDGGTASDALVKEEQTCEQTAPVNAGKIAGAECFGLKVEPAIMAVPPPMVEKWCNKLVPNVTPDMQINACTAAIESGKLSQTNLAATFFNRALGYSKIHNYDRAIADYSETLRIRPRDADSLNSRGRAYNQKKDYDRAIADLDAALRIDPNMEYAYYNRGVAYRGKKDYDRAISDFKQAIRLDAQDDDAMCELGSVYLDKGDYGAAIANYNDALRIKPDKPCAFNNRGWAYYLSGNYDRAIADLSEAIRLDPKDKGTVFNRALVYYVKKDYDRAISDYDEGIRLDPTNELAFRDRGIVYFDKGDSARAIADYNEAIRLKPDYANAIYNRGRAYEREKDYDRAIVDFSDVIRLAPTDAKVRNLRCWNRALAGRDLQGALADCDESLRLNPDGNTFNSRGLVQLKLGAYDRAMADYDSAIILNGTDFSSLYGRGLAKLRSGDTAGGNADISDAKAGKGDIADIYAGYGISATGPAATQAPVAPNAQTAPAATQAPVVPAVPAAPAATHAAVAPPVQAAPSAAGDCSRAETHWKSAEEIGTLAVYQDHLRRFPKCDFAGLAAARIEQLSKNSASPARADEAEYKRCVGERTSIITDFITRQCRADMAKRTPYNAKPSEDLVYEEWTCEQTAPANAAKRADAECFSLKSR